jgi:polyisoprenoid-binding protein YceI
MKIRLLVFGFLILPVSSLFAAPITMHVDNTHSSIQFSVPFFGVSEVTGRFERFCGNLLLDETNMASSRLELFIDASSINTGLKIRDKDLVSKYLEAEKYPIIYFKSKSIRLVKPRQFEVVGDLNMHGVVKELQLVMNVIGDINSADKAREIGFKLQPLMLNRTDYGILEGATGSGSVGDTVTISSVIRVRDVTQYRKDLDVRYPEKNSLMTLPFSGSYVGAGGEHVTLVQDKGSFFLSFSDNEWSWFAQAQGVGPNLYKLLSFGNLVDVQSGQIVYTTSDGKSKVLAREAAR